MNFESVARFPPPSQHYQQGSPGNLARNPTASAFGDGMWADVNPHDSYLQQQQLQESINNFFFSGGMDKLPAGKENTL